MSTTFEYKTKGNNNRKRPTTAYNKVEKITSKKEFTAEELNSIQEIQFSTKNSKKLTVVKAPIKQVKKKLKSILELQNASKSRGNSPIK